MLRAESVQHLRRMGLLQQALHVRDQRPARLASQSERDGRYPRAGRYVWAQLRGDGHAHDVAVQGVHLPVHLDRHGNLFVPDRLCGDLCAVQELSAHGDLAGECAGRRDARRRLCSIICVSDAKTQNDKYYWACGTGQLSGDTPATCDFQINRVSAQVLSPVPPTLTEFTARVLELIRRSTRILQTRPLPASPVER